MLKDMTLGQYFPGASLLHRLDPRMKIIIMTIFITVIFMASNVITISAVFLMNILLVLLSQINLKVILRGIRPLVFIITFTAAINVLWTPGENILVQFRLIFWLITVTAEGVVYAVMMVMRLVTLVTSASILISYTTSPTAFTDALERLLGPLKKIKAPVHEFSMMMMIALRFIPSLIDETDKIINAQKARGADFYSGSLIKRAKALIPILIPLIVSAFRRADELATAMECRCYNGGEGRTKMKQLRLAPRDFIAFGVTAVLSAGVIVLRRFT